MNKCRENYRELRQWIRFDAVCVIEKALVVFWAIFVSISVRGATILDKSLFTDIAT